MAAAPLPASKLESFTTANEEASFARVFRLVSNCKTKKLAYLGTARYSGPFPTAI